MAITERKWRTVRGKEVAVVKSWRIKTRDRKPYPCCSGTGSYYEFSKACQWQTRCIPLCRLCEEKVESITHVICSWSRLGGNQ